MHHARVFFLLSAALNVIFTVMQHSKKRIKNRFFSSAFFTARAVPIALLLLLYACAEHVPPPVEKPAPPPTMPRSQKPYQIYGVWYYPIPSAQGFREDGIASWYGDDFHGKPTSSGETYDMYAMTAAHKTLPLGTHVKVTNKSNDVSLILRINDRGPFVAGRVIDLSYTAAHKLGMLQPGTIPVRVEAVQVAEQTQLADTTVWQAETVPDFKTGNFSIQLGAFQLVSNAHKLKSLLMQKYENVSIQPPSSRTRQHYYRVQAGHYTDLQAAKKEADRFKQNGYPGAFVVAQDEAKS